jgi:hypothetical protein
MDHDQEQFGAWLRDTTPDARRVYIDTLRRMGTHGRARITFELSEQMRQIAASGVRHRHPEYTDDQVRLAVIRLAWGDELFREVFPGVEVRP